VCDVKELRLIPENGQILERELNGVKVGDYTGRCYQCGSSNIWDDSTAYGCNNCGWIRPTGELGV